MSQIISHDNHDYNVFCDGNAIPEQEENNTIPHMKDGLVCNLSSIKQQTFYLHYKESYIFLKQNTEILNDSGQMRLS